MKRSLLAIGVIASCAVLADVGVRNGGTYLGPVKDIDCARDAGLWCSRDSGTAVARIQCNAASAAEPGCVTPSAQTFAGDKTLTGFLRLQGVVHASLTACDVGHKNMLQGCTTHGAPVWCDGTANYELLGSQVIEEPLASMYVNGIPVPFFGAFTVSATSGWTITALVGFWNPGTGAGSIPLTFLSTSGTCTCTIDCDHPLARSPCSGNCSPSTGDTVFGIRGTSTCTLDPSVGGDITVMGTKP